MNQALPAFCWLLLFSRLALPAACSQTIPVSETLRRLAAQEDTDGDGKITILDQMTPFVIRDEAGTPVRIVTDECQLSVLMQELKRAGD